MNRMFKDIWVISRGGGELVSGAIRRLVWAGFPTVVLELEKPLAVRRLVAFAQAVFAGECEVEGVPGKRVETVDEAKRLALNGIVPVLVDPEGKTIDELKPTVLLDGRMAKEPLDTRVGQAPIVIALGPGIEAGVHADAVIETISGPDDGRAIYEGMATPDTGIPCVSYGFRAERMLKAPTSGVFQAEKEIGDWVEPEDVIGWVDDEPVKAQISGMLRGVLYSGLKIKEGTKLGDIDHKGETGDCNRTSEKADSVGAGVLEVVFRLGIERGIFAQISERASTRS
ncbi:MAG: selenium-dependent molybdenum cofactor biosynthesis protein YqeB [Candidatus Bipolaricaulia bacterium]